jgi:L-fuconolactonase
VTGTIVVEASSWVEDNQWVLDLASRDPFIVGYVGNLPAGTDAFAGLLARFANNRLFRGIRLGSSRLRDGLKTKRFSADLALLSKRDLALDLLGEPSMLSDVIQIARAFPDLRIVIDHVANLKIDGNAPPPEWMKGMSEAGRCRNIFCKVSGLVEGSGKTNSTAPRDVAFYKPVLDAIWECFGENRLIYGSNWPVSERFAKLEIVQSIVQQYFDMKGAAAVERVFLKNAQAAYKFR